MKEKEKLNQDDKAHVALGDGTHLNIHTDTLCKAFFWVSCVCAHPVFYDKSGNKKGQLYKSSILVGIFILFPICHHKLSWSFWTSEMKNSLISH
jgi:hypothetical protein